MVLAAVAMRMLTEVRSLVCLLAGKMSYNYTYELVGAFRKKFGLDWAKEMLSRQRR